MLILTGATTVILGIRTFRRPDGKEGSDYGEFK